MKILIANITDSGTYRSRSEIISTFLKEGHSVTIVSPRSDAAEKLIAMGCKFIEVKIHRHGLNPKEEFLLICAYRRILVCEKPNMVFSYTIKPNLYLGTLCRFMNIPYAMNITGLGEGLMHEGKTKRLLLKLYPIATKRAACIFFQNTFNKQFFIDNKLANSKLFKMLPGSGVNIGKFKPLDYPDEDNGIRFLFVSRIVKDKGIDELIEAIKIIKNKYKNVEFHFVGGCSKEYESFLHEWKDRKLIIYHGRISPEEVAEHYRYTHCLIHPSYHEGMANVILECAACARPCMASDINGCKEGIADGESGFLFRVKSVDSIVKKIEKFISLPHENKIAMGIAGRRKIEKEFDRQLVVDAYVDVFRKYAKTS